VKLQDVFGLDPKGVGSKGNGKNSEGSTLSAKFAAVAGSAQSQEAAVSGEGSGESGSDDDVDGEALGSSVGEGRGDDGSSQESGGEFSDDDDDDNDEDDEDDEDGESGESGESDDEDGLHLAQSHAPNTPAAASTTGSSMAKTPAAPSTGKKYTPRRYFEEEDTSITCRHCGGIGHMARECLNEKVNPPLGPRPTCHAVTLSRHLLKIPDDIKMYIRASESLTPHILSIAFSRPLLASVTDKLGHSPKT